MRIRTSTSAISEQFDVSLIGTYGTQRAELGETGPADRDVRPLLCARTSGPTNQMGVPK